MKKFNITVNGKSYEVDVEEIGGVPSAPVAPRAAAPAPKAAPKSAPKAAAKAAPKAAVAGGTQITAPMPGTIFDLKVNEGDTVSAGDVVLVLEAMKMENEISTPVDGTVSQILVKTGESVNGGDVMIVIE
ncbi:MAG: biotin/lipoyl-binding protein [Clostridiales bacterium]|nr:biotin/lipoyl-binding protein [Clostridiales bacterium]